MPEIIVKRRSAGLQPPSRRSPVQQGRTLGEWGRVDVLHSEDNTVDVLLDTGVHLKRIPVASKEWVIFGEDAEKDYNSGERDLPPLNARVFIMMPSCTYNDCFVAPFSGFNTIDRNASAPFMEDGREKIKERITPGGWHIADDYVTGSHKSVSPDRKTSLEIDYGAEGEPKEEEPELHLNLFDNIKADVIAEKSVAIDAFGEVSLEHKKGDFCKVYVYDTEIVIKNGEVKINSPKTIIAVDGDAKITTTGKTDIEAAGNATLKGLNVTVDAETLLTLKTGDAAAFCPNIMPKCPLGPVHGGTMAGIVKLKGA